MSDYANREWAGLIATFYLPRWVCLLRGRVGSWQLASASASWLLLCLQLCLLARCLLWLRRMLPSSTWHLAPHVFALALQCYLIRQKL